MIIVRVALDVPLPRLFDYLAEDADNACVGRLARVPFGKGEKLGLIVAVLEESLQPQEKLKPIHAPLTDLPPLPADWIALCEFCARYYQHPLGAVTSFALPPLLRRGKLPRRRAAAAKVGATAGSPPPLTDEQAGALAAIGEASGFETFLLHGVTGSGKTEVYLQAIARTLAQGRQALMLVPEIALTPQLEQRVAARFPDAHIVSAHSGVADAARARGFLDAFEGRADIVLGTRLSVFMPLPRLGLIVVDEEHDPSFKQQDGLRYSARDVAIFRAKQRDVPIVLGSATPSLESFHHGRSGRYRLLPLTQRALAANMPTVRIVDTRREKLQDGMSQALLDALGLRLARGEQSLVFLNRRGFAPVLACTACGWISRCRRCAANLVVHLADRRLRCHHCGLEAGIPRTCPDCGNQDIHPFGRGTQRLEATLQACFPEARVLRIDRDSANSPKKWQALLAQIHAGEADILVGTQMLAKGHDFPRLTLVGAVGADAALFAADFRAPERLFAQLMQVGGRSGRAQLPGEVLIQTEYPDHALYQALVEHDYARFASEQLDEREQAGFPPYAYQALLRAEAKSVEQSLAFLATAREAALALTGDGVMLYDPVPMRMYRLKNLERAQLLVESASRPALQAFLTTWNTALYDLKTPRDLRWHLDVDPLEL
ncbi:primosomal protein N' [Denitratisoma sp. DHT3]|uniref:primosomal protein N' n=1 Tax=Denitratisoma sp. DHT3 TaxID=1981880 RepID=UPI0011988178|nr:primosomal protein N' [Denitratisoma sp. DHT3]QDX81940.1 primosomal protein N' [Denitratisoma sp. DHT3]